MNRTQKYAAWAGGLVILMLAVWFGWQQVRKRGEEVKKEEAKAQVGETDSPEQLATLLYQAMYENDWFGATEDEDLIFEVGSRIGQLSNWDAVQTAYGRLFDYWPSGNPRNLVDDLTRSLDSEEYQRFIRMING